MTIDTNPAPEKEQQTLSDSAVIAADGVLDCTNPKIVAKIKVVCWVLLVLFFVTDLALCFSVEGYRHATVSSFDKESYIFFPLFGFIGCVLMVVGSKRVVATVLKRKDTYYDE